jgi:hypothetical protein
LPEHADARFGANEYAMRRVPTGARIRWKRNFYDSTFQQKLDERRIAAPRRRLRQIVGCTRYTLSEGVENGVEMCEFRMGSGFRFVVCPSRGMDIVFAEHNGRPLCWNSATGFLHPAFYEKKGPAGCAASAAGF